jgi:hypothetical protein
MDMALDENYSPNKRSIDITYSKNKPILHENIHHKLFSSAILKDTEHKGKKSRNNKRKTREHVKTKKRRREKK